MNDFYLKRLRKEADTYYHIRLNECGKYDIFFHNYQLTKVESNLSRQEAFERIKVHKRNHILKRVKQIKKKLDEVTYKIAKWIIILSAALFIYFKIF